MVIVRQEYAPACDGSSLASDISSASDGQDRIIGSSPSVNANSGTTAIGTTISFAATDDSMSSSSSADLQSPKISRKRALIGGRSSHRPTLSSCPSLTGSSVGSSIHSISSGSTEIVIGAISETIGEDQHDDENSSTSSLKSNDDSLDDDEEESRRYGSRSPFATHFPHHARYYGDDTTRTSTSSSTSGAALNALRALLFVAVVTTTVLYLQSNRRVAAIDAYLSQTSQHRRQTTSHLNTLESNIRQMGRDANRLRRMNQKLQDSVEEVSREHTERTSSSGDTGGALDVEGKKKEFYAASEATDRRRDRVQGLWRDIQIAAWRAIQDKYGEGPHYVRFELDFPDDDENTKSSSFVVKLASEHYMPHSVHVFLEMVEHGLWDGCSFPLSAGHLIKASPESYTVAEQDKMTPFEDAGLLRPSFPEYNSNYAHTEYTLGFVAAEGSNGFYINTEDNTDLHGPGAQEHNKLGLGTASADPCFGEVITGRDVIDRIRSSPVGADGMTLQRSVGIKKATVIQSSLSAGGSSPPKKSWPKIDFTKVTDAAIVAADRTPRRRQIS